MVASILNQFIAEDFFQLNLAYVNDLQLTVKERSHDFAHQLYKTPKPLHDKGLISDWQKVQDAAQIIKHHGACMLNSHQQFVNYVKAQHPEILEAELLPMAFPRCHDWTRAQNFTKDGEEQDLFKRIAQNPKLWGLRQQFIAEQSLDFLLKFSDFSHLKNSNANSNFVVADLFCETAHFLKALAKFKAKGHGSL